jgi:uncharacterized membrane protein YbhN (UPF0104 family)
MTAVGVPLESVSARPVSTARSLTVPWRTLAYAVLAVAVAVEIVLFAPYLVRATSSLRSVRPGWALAAIAVELVSMNAAAQVQRRMLAAAGATASACSMTRLTYAANALSLTLPGGTAVSTAYVFRRLRSWGATAPAAGFTLLASGGLSVASFALIGTSGVALAGGTALGSIITLVAVVAAGVGVAVVIRRRPEALLAAAERGLARANRLLHRDPDAGLGGLRSFVDQLRAIHPRRRDWAVGLGDAGLNWLTDLACLIAAEHAVGIGHLDLSVALLAYVAGMGTASLSPLPGGLGTSDWAMILTLTGGGLATVSATAAVLLYRLISFVLVVALGWIIWAASGLAHRRRIG